MRNLLTFLLFAASAFAQTATITDTIATPFAGTFSGTVTVSLNSPALAQPLYSGNVTLSGWTQTVTVTSGAFTLTLYTNDLITPGGTSYTATYAPTSGSGWKETWIVPTGATTIREIRSTTVPSPSVRFTPSQITQAGATLGQGLRWNGSIWAPAAVLTDPMTTTGDLITRSGINAVRLGIGSTNQVLTVAGGMPVWAAPATNGTVTSVSVTTANGVSGTVATATSTPAITLALGAITPTSVAASGAVTGSNLSGTNTGDQTTITGNAGTATALAANGTNCTAGSFPLGVDASGNAEGCTAAVTASTGLSDSSALVRNNQANAYTAGTKQTFASNATTAGAAFGGGISADPSSVSAGDLWYRADLGTFGFRNATAVDALVAGGRAVASGQVLYGTAAGVAGSNTNLRYFVGTGNLVVGTTTDDGTNRLQVAGNVRMAANTPKLIMRDTASGTADFEFQASGNFLNINRAGVAVLGTIDYLSGSFTWHNQTATTGVTQLIVRAGAGQSTTNLLTVQNSGGTALAGITGLGSFFTGNNANATGDSLIDANGLRFGSTVVVRWSNNLPVNAADASLSRASQNTLQVGDGSANSNGTIVARIHTWSSGTEGTCDATLRGQVVMVQGGAGVADRLRLCRKDATDTYLWAPVDNNVALQVVSAGPTATVTDQVRRVYVDPASVIASLTLTLPATPLDADLVQVYFGGTLANKAAVVTTLSIAPNTGHAISEFNAPANAFGGDMVIYEYRAAAARWYRIQ